MKKIILAVVSVGLILCGCLHRSDTIGTDNDNNKMIYRYLGKSKVEIGVIGIGCGCFEKMDTTESRIYMDSALRNGINYIDIYDANPKVRDNIGYALKGRRNQIFIQGHIGSYWENGQYKRTRDVAECKASFEDLLTRLGTDYVNVGMIHLVDSKEEWNEIKGSAYMKYVKQLKEEGKIKRIGLSSHNAEVAYDAVRSGLIEVLMFSINPAFDLLPADLNAWDSTSYNNDLTNIDSTRVKLYNYCEEHGIAIIVMKTFGGGRLLDAETSPLGVALTPTQCISYALSRPGVTCALSGADNVEELMAGLHYLTATDEEKDFSTALASATKACWKGDCIYCGHCAPCPADIDIDKVNTLLSIAKMYDENEIPKSIRDEYERLEHHASECTQCGNCESRCPFAVPVRDNMKEAARIFGK